MSEGPRGTQPDAGDDSAPWERPRRWLPRRLQAEQVDDLLTKLGPEQRPEAPRRAHRGNARNPAKGNAKVPASELIAALTHPPTPSPAAPTPDVPTTDTQSTEAPTTEVPSHHTPSPDPAATTDAPTTHTPSSGVPTADTRVPDTATPHVPTTDTAGINGAIADPQLDDATRVITRVTAPAHTGSDEQGGQPDGSADASPVAAGSTPTAAGPTVSAGGVPLLTHPAAAGDVDDHTVVIPKVVAGHEDPAAIRASLRRGDTEGLTSGRAGAGVVSPPPEHRARRRWLLAGRIVAALLAVILLAVVAWEWSIKSRAAAGIEEHRVSALPQSTVASLRPTVRQTTATSGGTTVIAPVPTTAAAPAPVYTAENILLLGSDTRAGANGNETNSDGTEGPPNSDTLMILHLSADRQHVSLLSIPRDTMIPAPRCYQWDYKTGKPTKDLFQTVPGDRWHINSAFSVGGPPCSVIAVESLTGLRIDRFIGIDFKGFQDMVNALNGIQVNICRPIVDSVLGTIAPSAGPQTVVGQQALSLVRARDVIGDTESDLARIHRQQAVLSAILRQVTSAGVLLNPNKLDDFLKAFYTNTFTDGITLDNLLDIANSLGDLNPDRVDFYTLPTVPSDEVEGALEVDTAKANAVFDVLAEDELLPGEKTAASSSKPSSSAGSTSSRPSGTASRTSAAGRTSAGRTPSTGLTLIPTGAVVPSVIDGAPSSAGTTATTLRSTDVAHVNAGSGSCV